MSMICRTTTYSSEDQICSKRMDGEATMRRNIDLETILKKHELYRDYPGKGCRADLGWADLSGVDLSGRYLSGVQGYRIKLNRAQCQRTYFDDVYFLRGQLKGIDASDAHFINAYIQEADFEDAVMPRICAHRARFCGSNMRNADLRDADFTNALLCTVDFTDANLDGANFSGADLTGATLVHCSMNNVNMQDAELSLSTMQLLHAKNCNFRDAKFIATDAHLSTFEDSNFEGAFFRQTDFRRTTLRGNRMTGAKFYNTILSGANLDKVYVQVNCATYMDPPEETIITYCVDDDYVFYGTHEGTLADFSAYIREKVYTKNKDLAFMYEGAVVYFKSIRNTLCPPVKE